MKLRVNIYDGPLGGAPIDTVDFSGTYTEINESLLAWVSQQESGCYEVVILESDPQNL